MLINAVYLLPFQGQSKFKVKLNFKIKLAAQQENAVQWLLLEAGVLTRKVTFVAILYF